MNHLMIIQPLYSQYVVRYTKHVQYKCLVFFVLCLLYFAIIFIGHENKCYLLY